jgi:replicative DNA helicase
MEKLSDANIYIDDTAGGNLVDLKSKARRLKIEKGLDLIVIDYLQLMTNGNSMNRVQEISEISRGIKSLARELDVPIIALSQLSRAVESRPDKRPVLSDLRESGAIEQDADIVMMMYREDYYDEFSEKK